MPRGDAKVRDRTASGARSRFGSRPARVGALTCLIGVVLTGVLVLTCLGLYRANEQRLLNLRARELGLVLSAAVPPIQTPLVSASELAQATSGAAGHFTAFLSPEVGLGRPFASVSLWSLGAGRSVPLARVGRAPQLSSAQAQSLFAKAAHGGALVVVGLVHAPRPSIGYEISAPGPSPRFGVYGESELPANRRSKLESNSAFSDLDYAVYLGRRANTGQLLVTSLKRLPPTGRTATTVVPFGDTALTLTVSAKEALGGTFFRDLAWIVGILGLMITFAATLLTRRLADGRLQAEGLAADLDRVAAENEQMYHEQRSIAETLQHALLPDSLPNIDGLTLSARYVAAAAESEVGGDWYDVVDVGPGKVFLVVGDVSGHGIRAATTMASLRHATLAYATHDPRPGEVLRRLSDFVQREPHAYFATVLCGLIDVDAHRLSLSSAGHLPPLLITDGEASFIKAPVNPPVGVAPGSASYSEATVQVPPKSIVLAFTDGLVERRGEVIDTGLDRLKDAAAGHPRALEDLVARLPGELTPTPSPDDTAIVAVQWRD